MASCFADAGLVLGRLAMAFPGSPVFGGLGLPFAGIGLAMFFAAGEAAFTGPGTGLAVSGAGPTGGNVGWFCTTCLVLFLDSSGMLLL